MAIDSLRSSFASGVATWPAANPSSNNRRQSSGDEMGPRATEANSTRARKEVAVNAADRRVEATAAVRQAAPRPVVNALGQKTGTIVNATA